MVSFVLHFPSFIYTKKVISVWFQGKSKEKRSEKEKIHYANHRYMFSKISIQTFCIMEVYKLCRER